MTRLTRACRHFYLLAAAALRLLNISDIGHDFFIFIIHKNLLFTAKKSNTKGSAAIGMLRQQQIDLVLLIANTAIARDLVSAFGPLLYGPHSY